MDQALVEHGFYKHVEGMTPTPILGADHKEEGIGRFCLRMTCVLPNNSSAKSSVILKYTIVLLPSSKEALLDQYDLTQSAAWLGLWVTDGYLPLIPRPSKNWGCPVIQFIKPRAPLAELAGEP